MEYHLWGKAGTFHMFLLGNDLTSLRAKQNFRPDQRNNVLPSCKKGSTKNVLHEKIDFVWVSFFPREDIL